MNPLHPLTPSNHAVFDNRRPSHARVGWAARGLQGKNDNMRVDFSTLNSRKCQKSPFFIIINIKYLGVSVVFSLTDKTSVQMIVLPDPLTEHRNLLLSLVLDSKHSPTVENIQAVSCLHIISAFKARKP